MSNRKETPDLLGDILSPQPAAPVQNESVQSKPASTPSSNPAPKTTPKTAQRKTTSSRSTKPVTPQPAMPQWEYMEVIFREFRGWRPRFVNGEELEDWREQPEIRDYLAVVGAEGWEMIGIMENKRNTRSIYFKRPSH